MKVTSQNASNFMAVIDGMLDDAMKTTRRIDFDKVVASSKLTKEDLVEIQDCLSPKISEWEEVVLDLDEQLVEGYSNFTKPQQKYMLDSYYDLFAAVTVKKYKRRVKKVTEAKVLKPTDKKEQFSMLVGVIDAYKQVRVFTNVTVTGKKMTCESAVEYKLPKGVSSVGLSLKTEKEMKAFIASCSKSTRKDEVPTALWSKKIKLVKYAAN